MLPLPCKCSAWHGEGGERWKLRGGVNTCHRQRWRGSGGGGRTSGSVGRRRSIFSQSTAVNNSWKPLQTRGSGAEGGGMAGEVEGYLWMWRRSSDASREAAAAAGRIERNTFY